MSWRATFQFIGPACVFAAVTAAEGAAYALAQAPSSATLWHINLDWFGIFQKSHYMLSAYTGIGYFQFRFIALPLLALASVGLLFARPFVLAVAGNLSFVYALFLVYCWVLCEPAQEASLIPIAVPSAPDLSLGLVIFVSSLLSFVMSHMTYVRDIRHERR